MLDHNGNEFLKDDQYSTAGNKVITQQQRKRLLESKAEKLIKKYFLEESELDRWLRLVFLDSHWTGLDIS